MTSSQQDESIYQVPSIQYPSDSAAGSGSRLAGTGNGMFVVSFPMEPLASNRPEYSIYDWSTCETYEAPAAACQPPSKSENHEGEGCPQRTAHLMGIQSFTDDCITLPDGVQAFGSHPNLFPQQLTPPSSIIADASDLNGSLLSFPTMVAPGSPSGNSSWTSDTWNTLESKPFAPTYLSTTIDPRHTFAAPFTLSEHPSSEHLHQVARLETAHDLLSVPGGHSVQTPIYASEEDKLDAIRALIRHAPFMTSRPQCLEPTVGSLEDHYTGGRGIPGKSIFTAFINTLPSGEYQCIQCETTYKKLERAIGDQAKHFEFKPYICEEKHNGKTACGKAFGMKDYRKTHQERENQPSVRCGACPAEIKHARNLPRHMQQVHGQSAPSPALPKRPTKRRRLVGKVALYEKMWK